MKSAILSSLSVLSAAQQYYSPAPGYSYGYNAPTYNAGSNLRSASLNGYAGDAQKASVLDRITFNGYGYDTPYGYFDNVEVRQHYFVVPSSDAASKPVQQTFQQPARVQQQQPVRVQQPVQQVVRPAPAPVRAPVAQQAVQQRGVYYNAGSDLRSASLNGYAGDAQKASVLDRITFKGYGYDTPYGYFDNVEVRQHYFVVPKSDATAPTASQPQLQQQIQPQRQAVQQFRAPQQQYVQQQYMQQPQQQYVRQQFVEPQQQQYIGAQYRY